MGKSSRCSASIRSGISGLRLYRDRYLAPPPEAQKQTSEKVLIKWRMGGRKSIRHSSF